MHNLRKIFIIGAGAAVVATMAYNRKADISRNMEIFGDVFRELNTVYVDTIDPTKTMRTAIDAMLGQIDPYTEFYSEEEQDRLTSVSTGQYAGIGSVISKRDTNIILTSPYWDSPARRAGVRHGDILLSVNGQVLTKDITTDAVSKMLKGDAGTTVNIRVQRPWVSGDSIFDFTITRGNITINPIHWAGMLSYDTGKATDSIAYISVNTFNEKTATQFADSLTALQSRMPLKGLIVDLRGNGGGIITGAVQLASNFVPKGTPIVTTRYRDPHATQTYKTMRQPIAPNLPLVVLTDDGTASASEIFAGAMQDLDRGVLVGERSYGKGLVQQGRPLPFGAMMKVTTGRYYLPSGRLIQAIDYRHRSADGKAQRIPDSLTSVFHTRAGREVRDGGGITPEVKVELPDGNRLLYNIAEDMWDYNFANKVANSTLTPPPVARFAVDSTMFADFKAFIDPNKFKYDRATESGIEYLREATKAEGYDNPQVSAMLDSLDNMLHHNLQRDLDNNRELIAIMLRNQLMERWYSDGDIVRYTSAALDDPYIKAAVMVLTDPRQYNVYLTTSKPAK